MFANLLVITLIACWGSLLTDAAPGSDPANTVKISTANSYYKLDIVSALSNWQTLSTAVSQLTKHSPLVADIIKEAKSKNPYLQILLGSKRPSLADLLGIANSNTEDPLKSLAEATEHQVADLMVNQQHTVANFLARITGKTLIDYQDKDVAISSVNHNLIPAKEVLSVLQWGMYNLKPLLALRAALTSHVISFDDFVSNVLKLDFSAYEKAHIQTNENKTTIDMTTIESFLNFIVAVNPGLKQYANIVIVEDIAYSGMIYLLDWIQDALEGLIGSGIPGLPDLPNLPGLPGLPDLKASKH